MIDKHAFTAGMTALSAAFGREVDGATQRMYYGILSPKLTTAEYDAAILRACESETFWPSPAVILGKVPRLKEDAGYLAFEHVNKVTAEHGGYRFLPHETFLREFDEPTRAAIRAVGGLGFIANTSEDRWTALAKRFAAAYQSAQPALSSGEPVKQIPASTAAVAQVDALVQSVAEKRDWRRAASNDR